METLELTATAYEFPCNRITLLDSARKIFAVIHGRREFGEHVLGVEKAKDGVYDVYLNEAQIYLKDVVRELYAISGTEGKTINIFKP